MRNVQLHFRTLLLVLVPAGLPLTAKQCPADERVVFDLIRTHCVDCHNPTKSSGDLDLQTLSTQGLRSFDVNREAWERVVAKMTTGEMPPPEVTGPSGSEVVHATKWLKAEFLRQDRAIQPQAGRVTVRRLNRAEYTNTVRDLLGVNIRPAEDFPPDQSAFGFDNISDALRLSPVLMEKYLNAAERVITTALFGPKEHKPSVTHYPLPVRINLRRGTQSVPQDLPNYDLTGLSTVHAAHVVHHFPVEAEYDFRIVLNGHRPTQSEPAHPALFIDGVCTKEFEIDATDLEGQVVETRLRVTAGEHLLSATYLKMYHGLPPNFHGPEPSKRPPGPLLTGGDRLNEQDIEILRKLGTTIKTDMSVETRIDNRFESIDIGGPFNQQTAASPAALKRVYVYGSVEHGHTAKCARVILTDFASRAFRRPAATEEVDRFLRLFKLVEHQGDSFEKAIATALQAILVSPHFLFRIEHDRKPSDGRSFMPVSDYELASRLSYFIWSSMPDTKLLQSAADSSLRRPDILEAQVRRMLRDPKSRALVENFAGQWLQFRNIDIVRPDPEQFATFEESLRHSMKRETARFLEEIIREDRSVLEILNADYTFVDERLARFYGFEGIHGPGYQRVDVSNTRRGGGILSHGSILTLTSYSTRTSPVLRGKWILETLLNDPPPPPPPSVPALDESKVGKSVSLRQELEEHRNNPTCAGCHARLDPLGFSLEHFNAIGEWRDLDGKEPVDASGTLPSGLTFQGHAQLKQILMDDRDSFVDGLAEKLLIYALGRGLQRHDRPALAKISESLPAADYRFSELVLGIVNSLPFQMRNVAEQNTADGPPTGETSP
ncbi:MAG: DUF1592 domain-containing protein [Fuerstiella sp.]|nr:DUF1592 domain-containing protein [Fuerstiella sp.]